jgi:hypothetical protein
MGQFSENGASRRDDRHGPLKRRPCNCIVVPAFARMTAVIRFEKIPS